MPPLKRCLWRKGSVPREKAKIMAPMWVRERFAWQQYTCTWETQASVAFPCVMGQEHTQSQ